MGIESIVKPTVTIISASSPLGCRLNRLIPFNRDKEAMECMESMNDAKEVVLSYIKALENQDYTVARRYMNDYLPIKGPGELFDKPEKLLKILQSTHAKYDVKKVFVDGDDVCLLYDLTTSTPAVTVFTCSWYHVKGGKIASIWTIFDPRPFVPAASKPTQ
jgi:hypothetical protein